LGAATPASAESGTENCQYFSETGHYVCDEFLTYFDAHGGLEIFGYPRSVAFFDSAVGRTVQYFQRARLEMHPDNPEPYRVQLGLLGDELGYTGFPTAVTEDIPTSNDETRHYFPETGHVVSLEFLQFYRDHGGLDTFGYPRSEFMYADGYIVQYFQRARMEWHSDSQPEIVLTNLGDIYIEHFGVPQTYLEAEYVRHDQVIAEPTVAVSGLTVTSFVHHVIVGKDEQQTVFIYVADQDGTMIENALGTAVIHYPAGDQVFSLVPTNSNGFTSQSFYVAPSIQPGEQVVIETFVDHAGLAGESHCDFVLWW
jgi:hypothetical protein